MGVVSRWVEPQQGADQQEEDSVSVCHHGLSDGRLLHPQPHRHQLHHHGEYTTWTGPVPDWTWLSCLFGYHEVTSLQDQ